MNINEIAKLAGVSRATVSRYLNNGYVSDEKKSVIRKVIEETGYEPSMQAQNLRKKITKFIGVIIPKIQSESVSRMVEGISSILSGEGYQLLLANTQNNVEEELKFLKLFKSNYVDGIIFVGTIFDKRHYEAMKEIEVPIIVIGQQTEDFSCIYHDDYNAALEAAKLVMNNSSKTAYIGVTLKDRAAGYSRWQGFMKAAEECGIKTDARLMKESDFKVESGYQKTGELFLENKDIDAIFCATDSIAVGALKWLHEHDFSVPADVQLIGFGNTELGSVVSPSIATVHFYYKTCGMEAAKMILEILRTGQDNKKTIKLSYEIVKNKSLR